MRRKVFVAIATLAALLAVLVATSISAAPPPVGYATTAVEYELFAGQSTSVGKVYVWDWADKVYVQFVTDADWCITETHVAVGETEDDIPQTSKGNPIPGQFPAGETFSTCVGAAGPYVLDAPSGDDWVVAAHAKVWDKTSLETVNVVSGTGTTVTQQNGVVVSHPAALANEPLNYPNCASYTPNTNTSVWDTNAFLSGLVAPSWGTADWIWAALNPLRPIEGDVIDFQHSFTAAGWILGPGSLMITADNANKVALNGAALGQSISLGPGFTDFSGTLKENVGSGPQQGLWGVASQGWQLVNQYAVTVTPGANLLQITAANEFMAAGADNYLGWDAANQQYTATIFNDPTPGAALVNDGAACYQPGYNPAGLIYKLSFDQYTRSETAWGEGTRFVEQGSWATYMEYAKGDGQVVFAQNDSNDIRMAFFITDAPDAGPVGWIDFVGSPPADPTTFGQATGTADCYLRTGIGPDFARFSGTNTPVTIGATTYTNFLFGIKEGGAGTGAARIRLGNATTTNCVTPVGPMTNADINGDVQTGTISIYFP